MLGLFLGELIFGGAYYLGGLIKIIGRIFASEIWEAYFREGSFFFFFWGGGGGAYYRNLTVFSLAL